MRPIKEVSHEILNNEPLYLCSEEFLLSGVNVSVYSKYSDKLWQFDWHDGVKRSQSAVNWDIPFSDGSSLLDPQHVQMLCWARRLVLIVLFVSVSGKYLVKTTGLASFSQGIRRLLQWMVFVGISQPRHLSPEVLATLEDDIGESLLVGGWEWMKNNSISGGVNHASEQNFPKINQDNFLPATARSSVNSALTIVRVVTYLWTYRAILLKAGIDPMQEPPWPGRSGMEVAEAAGSANHGWIRPLPDQIVVPLLNSASRLLGEPAEDIIRLQELMYETYFSSPYSHPRGPGKSLKAKADRQNKVASQFTFSTLPGEISPWHPMLVSGRTKSEKISFIAASLIKKILAAAGIIIQATTGLRISELCSLESGISELSGFPCCVDIVSSHSGVSELFILNGKMIKGEFAPNSERWLLGMRPSGSAEIPISVRALMVVDRLLSRARKMADSTKLFLSIRTSGGSIPKSRTSVFAASSSFLHTIYKDFAEEFVPWNVLAVSSESSIDADELDMWIQSRGRILRSARFRKTFASYVLSESPDLLPSVKRQFRHMSMALTDQGYWGSGYAQVEPFESVTRQETAYLIHNAIFHEAVLHGRMGDRIEKEILSPLRHNHKSSSNLEVWRAALEVSKNIGVEAFHGRDGACIPIKLESMACHRVANTRPLGNRLPNFQTRTNSLCTGCECFVMSRRHLPYWEEKYVDLQTSWLNAEQLGFKEGFDRIKARAQLAKKIVNHLGGNIENLDRKIMLAVK